MNRTYSRCGSGRHAGVVLGGYGNQKSVLKNPWIPFFKGVMDGTFRSMAEAKQAYYNQYPQTQAQADLAERRRKLAQRRKLIRATMEDARSALQLERGTLRGLSANTIVDRNGRIRLRKGVAPKVHPYHADYRSRLIYNQGLHEAGPRISSRRIARGPRVPRAPAPRAPRATRRRGPRPEGQSRSYQPSPFEDQPISFEHVPAELYSAYSQLSPEIRQEIADQERSWGSPDLESFRAREFGILPSARAPYDPNQISEPTPWPNALARRQRRDEIKEERALEEAGIPTGNLLWV